MNSECLKNHQQKSTQRVGFLFNLEVEKLWSPNKKVTSHSWLLIISNFGAMDSVDPADAQPAAGVEDELSRLGRCGFK